MKHMMHAFGTLALLACAACAIPAQATAQPTATESAPVAPVASQTTTLTVVTPTAGNAADEAAVRQLVEGFGQRLQSVSLLAPDAPQQMQQQYGEFVAPALLQTWMGDASKAPGRLVSSPWPDRIEITTIETETADRYVVTGFVIEVTSVELANGGAAARVPVRITVERVQGSWRITEYAQQQ